MKAYFAFTDECGVYRKIRSAKFLNANPFYTRATVIISLDDYLLLQQGMEEIKSKFGLNTTVEVKWQHFGSALKNNYKGIPHNLTSVQLKEYFADVLDLLRSLQSVKVYYTFTDNASIGRVDEIALLRMHLQNAFQRIQTEVSEKGGFAIVVCDDLNEKTKVLKQAVYKMTIAGDYVQYTHVKKGIYIDFSDQCYGLQIADICAGVFTTSLKYESALEGEKHKFQLGHDLFFSKVYVKTRNSFHNAPNFDVYKSGVKEVPSGAGETLAKSISRQIEDALYQDLMRELYG